MHHDVEDLREFYYRTTLGRVAQRAIRNQLLRLWPPERDINVAGFGFAVPLLRPYLGDARRVVGLMPGPQGVMHWPAGMPNISVLCEDTAWPLSTGFIDRLVLMHGLETTDDPTAVLTEARRVLAPGGRIVVVVPNRAGLWARRDVTPFGFGRPYTRGQLEAELRRHDLVPEKSVTVLHAPPSHAHFWLRTADFWERLGNRLPWFAGGILMVEATKQVFAPRQKGLRAAIRRPLKILEGVRGGSGPEPALNRHHLRRLAARRPPTPPGQ